MYLNNVNGNKNKKRILLSAFGIHMGGGLVLLESLLTAAEPHLKKMLIDARVKNLKENKTNNQVVKVRKSFLSRLIAQTKLTLNAEETDILFSFNSLPPLLSSRAYVINYVHAPHFVGTYTGVHYPFLTHVRHFIERVWFHCGLRNCDEVWVQTESMFKAILLKKPSLNVRVVPLVDEFLINASDFNISKNNDCDGKSFSFFYPADGVGHKNHARLLKAWCILKDQGLKPNLILTLRPEELLDSFMSANLNIEDYENVINIGRVPRLEVLRIMKESSGLIFPSLAETFGIPMLEAKMLNKPILASERDYVRDVCAPVQTFDPESPYSIARSVLRFVTGNKEPNLRLYSPAEFVEKIIDASN